MYGGINLDGTTVSANDDRNRTYFGKPVLPPNILVRATVSNKNAAAVLWAVGAAAVAP